MQYPPTSLPRMAMPDDILAGADLVELQPISPDRLMPDFGEHVLVTTASGRHVEAQRVPAIAGAPRTETWWKVLSRGSAGPGKEMKHEHP